MSRLSVNARILLVYLTQLRRCSRIVPLGGRMLSNKLCRIDRYEGLHYRSGGRAYQRQLSSYLTAFCIRYRLNLTANGVCSRRQREVHGIHRPHSAEGISIALDLRQRIKQYSNFGIRSDRRRCGERSIGGRKRGVLGSIDQTIQRRELYAQRIALRTDRRRKGVNNSRWNGYQGPASCIQHGVRRGNLGEIAVSHGNGRARIRSVLDARGHCQRPSRSISRNDDEGDQRGDKDYTANDAKHYHPA